MLEEVTDWMQKNIELGQTAFRAPVVASDYSSAAHTYGSGSVNGSRLHI